MTTTRNDQVATRLAGQIRQEDNAKALATEIRIAHGQGIVCTFDNIVESTLADGTPVFTLKTTGRIVKPARSTFGVKIAAVVLNDEGDDIIAIYQAVSGDEIDKAFAHAERNAANQADHKAAESTFVTILASVKAIPLVHSDGEKRQWGEARSWTITELEGLLEACSGRLESLRDGAAAVVEAPDPTQVAAAVAEAEQLVDLQERSKLRRLGIQHRNDCRSAVFALEQLGTLGLEYAKTGKRPKADHGRGKAERMGPAGIWLT